MMLYNIVESRSAKLGLACLESLAPAFQCNMVNLELSTRQQHTSTLINTILNHLREVLSYNK